MTFSRGRSFGEVLVAVILMCFLVGFVAVLCIGNYYRAKRAMERQKQRRMARLSAQNGWIGDHANNNIHNHNTNHPSPRSIISGTSSSNSQEEQQLQQQQRNTLTGGVYGQQQQRRRPVLAETQEESSQDLLLQPYPQHYRHHQQQPLPSTATATRPIIQAV